MVRYAKKWSFKFFLLYAIEMADSSVFLWKKGLGPLGINLNEIDLTTKYLLFTKLLEINANISKGDGLNQLEVVYNFIW